ncbi:helix-turn-helix transcriptional regulator [Nocardiopsis valliformis]|uniref:helix-turn-helix transcriptional regulator n=1 Tax=Nocardiopsis valliformis TaxID=239974 RepID=UPI000344FEB8|nr:transcriptional regulator [Nocardiopsis valliformis]
MRADRLLSLLLLLQNRGRMSAPEIAAELEVSVRTVYRDVEALGTSGIPVYADRGPRGGFALVDGYRTRLTGLSGTEAHALFLAGTPAAAEDLGLGAVLATAQLKLRAALPAALAERTRAVAERFHLDAPAWFREADEVPHLAAVAGAVWDQRVVRVHYRRWRGEVRRELCPLGVVLKGGLWYLVAQAESAAGNTERAQRPVRTYRVSRFLEVEVTEELFERPAGFDLAASWEESSRRLEGAVRQGIARVRLSPRARALLPMKFGAAGTRALEGAGPPDTQGWVEADLEVEASTIAVGDLLSLGAEAEVLGPAEIRQALAREVAALATLYPDSL